MNMQPMQRRAMAGQRGLTMVELLVAMAVSTVIALAAIAALTVSRQGFTTVDAASQLRDNGRFASDLIQRLAQQSGYRDVEWVAKPRATLLAGISANPRPDIFGFNNASLHAGTELTSADTRTAGSVGYGSDILVLSFQASKLYPDINAPTPGWNTADQSVIDCSGNTPALVKAPTASEPIPAPAEGDRDLRMISILHVALADDGEPSLMCSRSSDNGVTFDAPVPVIQGVESFQVLYGMDAVTAGTPPALGTADIVPDSYLRADQIGSSATSYDAWRRVRSLRIGMIVRAKASSNQDRVAETFYPLGRAPGSSGGAVGSAMSSTNDPGTVFTSPVDGRLRQAVTFTVYLHNQQEN